MQQSEQPLISLDRIIKNEKKIEQSISSRAYYRYAFTGTKVCMGTVAAIRTVADTVNTAAWFLGYNQPINTPGTVQAQESRKEWLLKSIISLFGTVGFYYFFTKLEQQYGSAADIRWFVTVQSPFYTTLRELYFLGQEAPLAKNPQRLQKEMRALFNKLVDQTEQVIAFMRYKKEKFSEQRKVQADAVIDHLIERSNIVYSDVAHALDTDAHNVTYHLDSILMLLEGDCARFARAEGSQWINPSAILDMMHNAL